MAPHHRRTYRNAALVLAFLAPLASAQVETSVLAMIPPTNSAGAPTGSGIIKWIGGASQVPTIDVSAAWSPKLLVIGDEFRMGNAGKGNIISLATGSNTAFQNVGGTFTVSGNGAVGLVGLFDSGTATNSINTAGGISATKLIATSSTAINSITTPGGLAFITNSKRTSLSGSASAANTVDYKLPDDAPTMSGYVLTSDTMGVLSWAPNGAGSGVTSLNALTGGITLANGGAIGISAVGTTITLTNNGVTALNSLTGSVSVAAGTGIGVMASGSSVTVSNTGVTDMNGLTGSLSIVNGGGITVTAMGSTITLASASAVCPAGPVNAIQVTNATNCTGSANLTWNGTLLFANGNIQVQGTSNFQSTVTFGNSPSGTNIFMGSNLMIDSLRDYTGGYGSFTNLFIGGVQVIDASRNITNINTASAVSFVGTGSTPFTNNAGSFFVSSNGSINATNFSYNTATGNEIVPAILLTRAGAVAQIQDGSGAGSWQIFGNGAFQTVSTYISTTVGIALLAPNGSVSVQRYSAPGGNGVTCAGAPTGAFASSNGIVTHC